MFAYCFNSPLKFTDSGGGFPVWLDVAVSVAVPTVITAEIVKGNNGSTPILVDKGQKGRGTASCNLPATRYIIEANPLNVLKPRAFRFAACIMELIPSQTAFVMRW